MVARTQISNFPKDLGEPREHIQVCQKKENHRQAGSGIPLGAHVDSPVFLSAISEDSSQLPQNHHSVSIPNAPKPFT